MAEADPQNSLPPNGDAQPDTAHRVSAAFPVSFEMAGAVANGSEAAAETVAPPAGVSAIGVAGSLAQQTESALRGVAATGAVAGLGTATGVGSSTVSAVGRVAGSAKVEARSVPPLPRNWDAERRLLSTQLAEATEALQQLRPLVEFAHTLAARSPRGVIGHNSLPAHIARPPLEVSEVDTAIAFTRQVQAEIQQDQPNFHWLDLCRRYFGDLLARVKMLPAWLALVVADEIFRHTAIDPIIVPKATEALTVLIDHVDHLLRLIGF